MCHTAKPSQNQITPMNTELVTSYETEILAIHEELAAGLDQLRQDVCTLAHRGADMGDHIAAWSKETHAKADEVWTRLQALAPHVREDVIRFALKSSNARKRGMLDDASQLVFALAGTATTQDAGTEPPVKHAPNEIALLTNQVQRALGFVREWQEKQPVARWSAGVKESVRSTLKPLVELYEKLA